VFPHHNIHKYTQTSPDENTHNQINHTLVNKRWHSSIGDIQFFRGADCNTGHYVVVAKVRAKLSDAKNN